MNEAIQHGDLAGIERAQVDHLGIVVPDLTAATRFYRDVLGCHVSEPIERPGQGLRKAHVSFGNIYVELISPTTPDSPIKHVLEEHNVSDFVARNPGGGLHHVCYSVPNLDETRNELVARGYRFLGTSGPVTGQSGTAICFLDPQKINGVLIELKQR
jgi:methylmalonyl-CoA/ethylmalonyl-CoA epimerase